METQKQRQSSDPFSVGLFPAGSDKPESSSLSDSGSEKQLGSSHSEKEYLLATSRPKKRAGRKIFKETRHPIFRGVRRRNNNKWVCELREPNKKTRIWLGTYPTPEIAARAHDVAALAFRGKSACLNFADSVWRLPVPASLDAKDVRRAAAEAAEAFRPHHEYEEVSDESSAKAAGEEKYVEQKSHWTQNMTFVDEEEVFGMPGLLVDMAEGLLLLPPPLAVEDDTMKCEDDMENDNSGVWLWNYSF